MSFIGSIGDFAGSAVGAIANVVKNVPTFGAVASGVLNSASALLKGGTVTTNQAGQGSVTISTAGNVTTPAGQPPASTGFFASLTRSKIFGIPLVVAVPGLALIVWLIWKSRGRR